MAWVLAGCASYGVVENQPISPLEPDAGYSLPGFVKRQRSQSPDLSLVLAFSGGGTRAAALSYGLLQELRDCRVVLDAVTAPTWLWITTARCCSATPPLPT